jgi:two-component system C4-dicarboxylate transport sensor histidine kinase DctB
MALPLERLCAAVADELHRLCSLLQERLARLAHAGPDAVLDAATLLSGVSAHLTLLEGRLRCLAAPPASQSGPANVTVALREAIALVQAAGQPGETMVGLDLAPDLPRPALGDAALRQVLAELLHNAILATANSEEKRVRVSVRAEEGSVSIEVADTGIGILPADVERIFEPLVSSRRAPFGVGLGLYCCRRILGPVGATIVASGRPGRGATFIVRIPTVGESSG